MARAWLGAGGPLPSRCGDSDMPARLASPRAPVAVLGLLVCVRHTPHGEDAMLHMSLRSPDLLPKRRPTICSLMRDTLSREILGSRALHELNSMKSIALSRVTTKMTADLREWRRRWRVCGVAAGLAVAHGRLATQSASRRQLRRTAAAVVRRQRPDAVRRGAAVMHHCEPADIHAKPLALVEVCVKEACRPPCTACITEESTDDSTNVTTPMRSATILQACNSVVHLTYVLKALQLHSRLNAGPLDPPSTPIREVVRYGSGSHADAGLREAAGKRAMTVHDGRQAAGGRRWGVTIQRASAADNPAVAAVEKHAAAAADAAQHAAAREHAGLGPVLQDQQDLPSETVALCICCMRLHAAAKLCTQHVAASASGIRLLCASVGLLITTKTLHNPTPAQTLSANGTYPCDRNAWARTEGGMPP